MRGVAVLLACALALAWPTLTASQTAAPPEAAQGWRQLNDGKTCSTYKGDLMVGTGNGRTFVLVLHGIDLAGVALRQISVDGRPLLVPFTSGPNSTALTPLDASSLALIANAHTLTADWPEAKGAHFDLSDLGPALPVTQKCAADLEAKRVHAEQATQRRQKWAARLQAMAQAAAAVGTGADTPSSPPRPGIPGVSGMMCMKRGEAVSGFTRNCVYDCAGSRVVQTIGNAELCPISMSPP